ncbi:MAG: hypothetical protein ACXW2E_02060 [Nitrososphaeraceae archaeon]
MNNLSYKSHSHKLLMDHLDKEIKKEEYRNSWKNNPIIQFGIGYIVCSILLAIGGLLFLMWGGVVFFAPTYGIDLNLWIVNNQLIYISIITILSLILWWMFVSLIFRNTILRIIIFIIGIMLLF